jgi:hypothetical protein
VGEHWVLRQKMVEKQHLVVAVVVLEVVEVEEVTK